MISKALIELGDRTSHSFPAISKYIESNYPVPSNLSRFLRIAIKRLLGENYLVKDKASYKLSKDAKTQLKKRTKKVSSSSSPSKPTRSKPKEKESSVKKRKSTTSDSSTSNKKKEAVKPLTKKSRSVSKVSAVSSSETTVDGEITLPRPFGLKADQTHIWQYFDKIWKNYDNAASETCEDVYQKYLANRGDTDVRAVHSGQWEYQVDFMAMKQTNIQHENHTVRNIRRVKLNS